MRYKFIFLFASVFAMSSFAMNYDYSGINELLKKNDLDEEHLAVYGHWHCNKEGEIGFYSVFRSIELDIDKKKGFFKCAYNFHVGKNRGKNFAHEKTYEERVIEKIATSTFMGEDRKMDYVHDFAEYSKAGIVNIVLENYKRSLEGKKLIPLIFFVGSNLNDYVLSSKDICQRTEKDLKLPRYTNREIRRSYKLISKEELLKFSSESQKIERDVVATKLSEIAKKSILFMSLFISEDKKTVSFLDLEQVWLHKDFQEDWNQRMESKVTIKIKQISWREELLTRALKFSESFYK